MKGRLAGGVATTCDAGAAGWGRSTLSSCGPQGPADSHVQINHHLLVCESVPCMFMSALELQRCVELCRKRLTAGQICLPLPSDRSLGTFYSIVSL